MIALPLAILLWFCVASAAAATAFLLGRLLLRLLRRQAVVALVTVEGTIGMGAGPLGGGRSALGLVRELSRLGRDPAVRAVLLRIDSPGGAVGATEEVALEVARLRERGRTVVVSVGNAALSGGFWLAMEGDAVVAPPGALLGSIGVIIQKPELSRLFERVGIGRSVAKSRSHKDFMSPYRDWDEEERSFLSEVNEEIFARFVARVAERRRLPEAAVLSVADGRVFTAARALELGFVDQLGNFEDAVALARRRAGLADDAPLERRSRAPWLTLWPR
jgi:protease-4